MVLKTMVACLGTAHEGDTKASVGFKAGVKDYKLTDDLMLASCGDDGQVMYWDLSTQCLVRSIGRHAGLVNAVKFNHFGSVIVSADSCVRLWDLRSPTMDPIKIFDTFEDIVTSLCVKRAEIIAGSYDGSVQQFDIRNNKRFSHKFGAPVTCISLANVGEKSILASCQDSTFKFCRGKNWIMNGNSTGRRIQRNTCELWVSEEWPVFSIWDDAEAESWLRISCSLIQRMIHKILHDSPWSVMGFYVALVPCDSNKTLNELELNRGEFWIQVHDLPLGMLSSGYTTELTKSLGKLIELDCVGEGPQTGRDFLPPMHV
ncbi:WD repeat domain-containing protein 83 [Tanacetum coccineum]